MCGRETCGAHRDSRACARPPSRAPSKSCWRSHHWLRSTTQRREDTRRRSGRIRSSCTTPSLSSPDASLTAGLTFPANTRAGIHRGVGAVRADGITQGHVSVEVGAQRPRRRSGVIMLKFEPARPDPAKRDSASYGNCLFGRCASSESANANCRSSVSNPIVHRRVPRCCIVMTCPDIMLRFFIGPVPSRHVFAADWRVREGPFRRHEEPSAPRPTPRQTPLQNTSSIPTGTSPKARGQSPSKRNR